MLIYGIAVSPYVQRCLMAARGKGHELDLRPVPGGVIHSPEFQAISPMGRIPLLELDDGTRICESAAITAYLEDVLDGPSLLPDSAVARARVRELETLALAELGGGLRPIMVHRVFRMPGADALPEAGLVQANLGMCAIEKLVGGGGFAVGEALTLADCALVPLLQLVELIGSVPGVEVLIDAHVPLFDYLEQVSRNNAAAAQTRTEMQEGFKALAARLRQPADAA